MTRGLHDFSRVVSFGLAFLAFLAFLALLHVLQFRFARHREIVQVLDHMQVPEGLCLVYGPFAPPGNGDLVRLGPDSVGVTLDLELGDPGI